MIDRMNDLGIDPGPRAGHSDDTRRVSVFAQSQSNEMKSFFQEVEVVKKNISMISSLTKEINERGRDQINETVPKQEIRIVQEMEKKLTENNRLAADTKKILEQLKEKHTAKTSQPNYKRDPEDRICENLLSTLTRKFVDVIKEYQNVQLEYKSNIQNKSKRLIKAVSPDILDIEVDKFLTEAGDVETARSVLLMGKSEEVRAAFHNASEKYQGVLKIERNMKELHEMFVEVAMHVEDQSELLELIETQVMSAQDHIDSAIVQTTQAAKLSLSVQKKKMCLCAILLIVIIVVVVFIVIQNGGAE